LIEFEKRRHGVAPFLGAFVMHKNRMEI